MKQDGQRLKQVTIGFSTLKDLECLMSLEFHSENIVIEGFNRKSKATMPYEITRGDALKSGILKEIYYNKDGH